MLRSIRILGKTEKIIHASSLILDWISRIILVILAITVIIDVIMRNIGMPVTGNVEIAELLMVALAYFAIANTHRQRGHIRVEILYSRCSVRTKDILDTITYSLAIVVYGLMTWALLNRFYSALTSSGKGPITAGVLELPISPMFLLIAFGLCVFCLELLIDLIKAAARINGKQYVHQ